MDEHEEVVLYQNLDIRTKLKSNGGRQCSSEIEETYFPGQECICHKNIKILICAHNVVFMVHGHLLLWCQRNIRPVLKNQSE